MATKEDTVVAPAVAVPAIYAALVNVATDLAKTGIAKDRKNEQQGYKFRGIDEVMNVVSPVLSKHFVIVLSTYEDYPEKERLTTKGTTLYLAKVKGIYTFISAQDGSMVRVTTFGEAMDSADKSMNKAMSAALKYCLLQTFLIPTEGDNDADATTPEETVEAPPKGFDEWFTDLIATADEGFEAMTATWSHSAKAFTEYAKKYREDALAKAKRKAISETNKAKKKAEPA